MKLFNMEKNDLPGRFCVSRLGDGGRKNHGLLRTIPENLIPNLDQNLINDVLIKAVCAVLF